MTNIEKIINDAWEKRDQINQKSDKNMTENMAQYMTENMTENMTKNLIQLDG